MNLRLDPGRAKGIEHERRRRLAERLGDGGRGNADDDVADAARLEAAADDGLTRQIPLDERLVDDRLVHRRRASHGRRRALQQPDAHRLE
jgi:hypothetical protein